jgi:hypothetical protein
MTLRTYIRLFRPIPSLVFSVCYALIAFAFGGSLFRLDARTAWFLASAVALPLLLGFTLAGTVHEPMHRGFILLLPDSTRQFRRVTALALLVLAGFVTAAAALANPAVSPVATFGLAAALLALPCLDHHQLLAGMGGLCIAAVAWIALNFLIGPLVQPAMLAAPWAFCAGGLAVAAAALGRGFSRAHQRQRAETYFAPLINSLALIFDRRTAGRQVQELLLSRERRLQPKQKPGRDWTVRSVGPSTCEWMRVLLHGFLGGRPNNSYPKTQLQFAAGFIVYVLGLPLLSSLFRLLSDRSMIIPGYWETLASFAGPISLSAKNPLTGMVQLMSPLLQPGFAMVTAINIVRPQLPFPISRERLARTVFGLSLLQVGVALTMPGTIIFLCSLLGQFISGHILPNFGLRSFLGVDLLLAVGLPLVLCSGTFRHAAVRLFVALATSTPIGVAVYFRDTWTPMVTTVPSVLISLLVCGGTVYLLWLCLLREYQTKDLLFEPGPIGASAR